MKNLERRVSSLERCLDSSLDGPLISDDELEGWLADTLNRLVAQEMGAMAERGDKNREEPEDIRERIMEEILEMIRLGQPLDNIEKRQNR